jgi:hypothetical protein
MAKATKRYTFSEQRKSRLARGLRRNHTATIETIHPKYKGFVKRTVKEPSSIGHKQYDKFPGHLMEGEDDENDDDFEPENEESTNEKSDDILLGLGFVPPNDRQSKGCKSDHRNGHSAMQAGEAMEAAETAAS